MFNPTGVHVLVDGQFGSTGKGALAAWLAWQHGQPDWAGVITSAGPNSGHTFYHGGEKHVLKQLPTFAVASYLRGKPIPVYFSAGAIIDPGILNDEMERYPGIEVHVHGCAAVLNDDDKASEHSGTIAAVAGTRSGTGAVLARKVQRDPTAVWTNYGPKFAQTYWHTFDTECRPYFMEISQGFSLGINSFFYPKVTSRECTVMQGLADARISYRDVAKTYMVVRSYPIRVGNIDGHSSGDWYYDQQEIRWSDIGIAPELTTVTQRQRRIATFSPGQLEEACRANAPDYVLVNFLNYLDEIGQADLWEQVYAVKESVPHPFKILGGYGPKVGDIWAID